MSESREQGSIHQRIMEMINFFSAGNKSAFGRKADLQSGVVAAFIGGRLVKPGFEVLQKLLTAYPEVSEQWLLFGEGEMLKKEGGTKDFVVSSAQGAPLLVAEAKHGDRMPQVPRDRTQSVPGPNGRPTLLPSTVRPPAGQDLVNQVAANTANIERILRHIGLPQVAAEAPFTAN